MRFASWFNRLMMASGVLVGAKKPSDDSVTIPGIVSETVGKSGNKEDRFAPPVAIARNLPCLTKPIQVTTLPKVIGTRPDSVSAFCDPWSLYETRRMSTLVRY